MTAGETFGRLTIIGEPVPGCGKGALVPCRCECGTERLVKRRSLLSGHTSSCGCASGQPNRRARRAAEFHFKSGAPEYTVWTHMVQRCTNPRRRGYEHYGGRGIRVCDRWRNSFAMFLADMGPRPSAKHSIDRVDNDGHYEPGNVRWATRAVQARNTVRSRLLTLGERTMCLTDWARELGLGATSLAERLERWPLERGGTPPVGAPVPG
jgi:hypothetical protein